VRLAALDLREDLMLDLEVLGWILRFRDSMFHLNSRVSHFCVMSPCLCKFRLIRVLECASEFMNSRKSLEFTCSLVFSLMPGSLCRSLVFL